MPKEKFVKSVLLLKPFRALKQGCMVDFFGVEKKGEIRKKAAVNGAKKKSLREHARLAFKEEERAIVLKSRGEGERERERGGVHIPSCTAREEVWKEEEERGGERKSLIRASIYEENYYAGESKATHEKTSFLGKVLWPTILFRIGV